MARNKSQESGDDVVARGADVPLALAQNVGPRDALVDPQDGDYVPDLEEKGYHLGTVRQPAEPVLHKDGSVQYESLAESDSKFDTDLIGTLKAAHNAADNAVEEPNLAPETPEPTDPYSGEKLADKS